MPRHRSGAQTARVQGFEEAPHVLFLNLFDGLAEAGEVRRETHQVAAITFDGIFRQPLFHARKT